MNLMFKQIVVPLAGGLVLLMGVTAQIVKLSRRRLAFRPARRDTLDSMTWRQFEQLVGAIYARQGYRIVELGGNGPDGGVDLVLHGNGEKVLVQCKQWRNHKVGVKDLREFYGVLQSKNTTANRGVFVTMGRFTDDASVFADENDLELVDGDMLLGMMKAVQMTTTGSMETALLPELVAVQSQGVSVSETSVPSCPACGRPMVLRTARKGARAGSQFWGCSGYPACKGKRQLSRLAITEDEVGQPPG